MQKGARRDYFGCIRTELFPKVDHVKETKYRAVSSDAAYYHLLINCLGKRGPGLSLSPRDVKVDSSTKVDEKLQSMLFSSFCCQPVSLLFSFLNVCFTISFSLPEKCPNTKFFLVRIFPQLD